MEKRREKKKKKKNFVSLPLRPFRSTCQIDVDARAFPATLFVTGVPRLLLCFSYTSPIQHSRSSGGVVIPYRRDGLISSSCVIRPRTVTFQTRNPSPARPFFFPSKIHPPPLYYSRRSNSAQFYKDLWGERERGEGFGHLRCPPLSPSFDFMILIETGRAFHVLPAKRRGRRKGAYILFTMFSSRRNGGGDVERYGELEGGKAPSSFSLGG